MQMAIRIAKRPDGSFSAWCPALPGCVVCARTKEAAQSRIQDAVAGYLSSLDVALPRELETRLQAEMQPAMA
jgi:predicted RNase H-like HicB family nuclease